MGRAYANNRGGLLVGTGQARWPASLTSTRLSRVSFAHHSPPVLAQDQGADLLHQRVYATQVSWGSSSRADMPLSTRVLCCLSMVG